MSDSIAALVCATGLWLACTVSATFDLAKRPAGEAWVVTASEKNPFRPALVRANVRFDTAAANATIVR